jgi:putative ABC transport system permease protein
MICMHSIWPDVRYAARGLRKQPAFAGLAILALALGIGSATTMFSVIHAVLVDPYPMYAHIDRLVQVELRDPANPRTGTRTYFPTPEFLDYQAQVQSFEDVIGGGFEDVLYTTADGTEQFDGGLMTPNNFEFMGVRAALGRTFTAEDARPGASPVFVMNHKLWAGRFGSDPSLVGKTFVLNGVPTTLVGVMPQRFFKLGADLYKPVVLDRADPVQARQFYRLQARLRPGVTLAQAEAEVTVVAQRLAKLYPDNYPKVFTVKVLRWADSIVGQFKTTLYTLAAAVALLLLIACSNVANMLLARAAAREKEMAVRSSLGASRGRLVRQLLVESLLLAASGAALGCVFAHFGLKALVSAIPEGLIPREAVIQINLPVLFFSLGAAVLTAVVFGLVPALQTARKDLVDPLRDSGKGTSGGFRRKRLASALVVAEVALSLVLLAGAGLLMRSFVNLTTADLGLDPEHVLFARVPLPKGRYDTREAKQQFFEQVLARVQALPGVLAASTGMALPPFGGFLGEIEIAGTTHEDKWRAFSQLVSEGHFATLRLKLQRGRLLSADDVAQARRVAVVNRTFVEKYLGPADPLGRTVRFKLLETGPGAIENAVFEIVGVVGDAKNRGIQEAPDPEAFLPYTVTAAFPRVLLVRTAGPPAAMAETLRREVWNVDRGVALTMTGAVTDYLRRFSYAEPRLALTVLAVFASLGMILVAIGVYSVIAYTVARQTHEIGIRMALGAERAHVLRMVLGMGARLVGLGLAVGLVASLAATRVLSSQLFGVAPHDVVTLALVMAVVAVAGAAACLFPARRAMRVDPMVALRYE